MALLLGIDTGGTFTDAVILKTGDDGDRGEVIAKAKCLTTHHDFAIGIAGAARQVIEASQCDPSTVGLVSLSTTLATNALVEGQGGRVALIAIGFDDRDLKNAGLAEALGSDPLIVLAGGHTTHGGEAKPLDLAPLEDQLDVLAAEVSGFAVAGYFAVRNPAHELSVRDLILARTGKAVTCSHELSAKLNGPKRALTTVLNARLVPIITRLIGATKRSLNQQNITAPLMIVRGDGALVGSDFAVRRPIETILSGPAASLVGARYLTGVDNAYINDIGGTTSDVAMLDGGRPMLDAFGARVGGFRTMVEAVAMHTFGLGGDSEVSLGGSALNPRIELGPRRLVPICLLAHDHGEVVHEALDRQLKSSLFGRHDGRFAFRSGMGLEADLSRNEQRLFDKLTDLPQALDGLVDNTLEGAALNRLVARGLVQVAGLTPSDALHVLGQHQEWDAQAAHKALSLFGRQRDGSGHSYCSNPEDLANTILSRIQRRSAEVVLEAAFQTDGKNGADHLGHPLITEILDNRERDLHAASTTGADSNQQSVALSLQLDRPLIGLGASAHIYHPDAARMLGTTSNVPENADVANAIGAVVGQVSMKAEITVSQPTEGCFQVTGISAPFADEEEALKQARSLALARAESLAEEAGAKEVEFNVVHDLKRAQIESRNMLVEGRIVAIANGRPPIIDQTD